MNYSIIFLIVIVALCYFQTILSQKENKYFGYILPALTFIAAVVLTFIWMDSFAIGKLIFTLLFINIPTYILILIYKLKKRKKK